MSVVISEDGKTIVSGSYDTTVRMWSLQSGKLLNVLKGHSDWVSSVAISQDGTTVASGSYDMTVRVWNSWSGKLLNELKGHSGSVRSVVISKNGTTIVSGSEDKTVRVWSVQNGTCTHFWNLNNTVEMITFSVDQNFIIVNNHQFFCMRTFNELDLLCELFDTNLNLVIDDWIVKSGRRLFWIPPSFRPTNVQAIAISVNTVAIGTTLGQIVIIYLNADKWGLATGINKRNNIKELLKEILKLNK
ncbi:WD40-repeat-containing domain protein [Cyathus striatus]|nr:WD40-repeat-containing domain protein [Cyathus striatus]